MDRRTFCCALTLGMLAVPLATKAQQTVKVWRVGVFGLGGPEWRSHKSHHALLQGLREMGYSEGSNLVFEFRWAHDNFDRLPMLAAELVALKVDVIVATAHHPPCPRD
jgi:putative tryptophan/tyrosine transport system substrate-binding protein